MSNTETRSEIVDCEAHSVHDPEHVQLIEPKDVQLGGPDALKVRRTLPSLPVDLRLKRRFRRGRQ